jgi:hypothetical protein
LIENFKLKIYNFQFKIAAAIEDIAHSRCGISKVGWAILFETAAKSDLRKRDF